MPFPLFFGGEPLEHLPGSLFGFMPCHPNGHQLVCLFADLRVTLSPGITGKRSSPVSGNPAIARHHRAGGSALINQVSHYERGTGREQVSCGEQVARSSYSGNLALSSRSQTPPNSKGTRIQVTLVAGARNRLCRTQFKRRRIAKQPRSRIRKPSKYRLDHTIAYVKSNGCSETTLLALLVSPHRCAEDTAHSSCAFAILADSGELLAAKHFDDAVHTEGASA